MKASELVVGQWYLQLSSKIEQIAYCCGRNSRGEPLLEFRNLEGVYSATNPSVSYKHIPNCTGFDHKFWEPPSFLKKGWVARDQSGVWYWCEGELIQDFNPIGGWFNTSLLPLVELSDFNWTPPHSDDVPWQKTLTEIL